jgi:hypothetical protein
MADNLSWMIWQEYGKFFWPDQFKAYSLHALIVVDHSKR